MKGHHSVKHKLLTSSLQDFVQLGLVEQLRVLSLDRLLQTPYSVSMGPYVNSMSAVPYQFDADLLSSVYVQACVRSTMSSNQQHDISCQQEQTKQDIKRYLTQVNITEGTTANLPTKPVSARYANVQSH